MDCMQFVVEILPSGEVAVSIPQAVWIACNYKICVIGEDLTEFQYRKRYGLHAIRWKHSV